MQSTILAPSIAYEQDIFDRLIIDGYRNPNFTLSLLDAADAHAQACLGSNWPYANHRGGLLVQDSDFSVNSDI